MALLAPEGFSGSLGGPEPLNCESGAESGLSHGAEQSEGHGAARAARAATI